MIPKDATPLFPHLQYCIRCCIPETQEGVIFDELGVCRACQSSEQKMHMDWVEREAALRKILDEAKARAGKNYDCIIPISGGKDSTFQLHVLTQVYGMKPLAVTFSHNWWSKSGWYNLQNTLETFNVDHITYTPNRALINKLARKSLGGIGDVSWHDHGGVGSFPLQVAVKWRIPLLIWGESIADSSGRASYKEPMHKFDREYFIRGSAKLRNDQMVGGDITAKDMEPFTVPSQEEIDASGVWGIHLGDYIFWDDEKQTEFLEETYGWRQTQMENTYKRYKSVEDIMSGMHDFTCYLKRGYGRATIQASMDVRNGLLTREEGFQLIREFDPQVPEALAYYLKITGMTEEEFYKTMETTRLPQMRSIDIPVVTKSTTNEERILPFPEQLIEELNPNHAVQKPGRILWP